MPRSTTKGICAYCSREFSKVGMTRHLETCPQRLAGAAGTGRAQPHPARLFHLAVAGRYAPDYWMNLEVPADMTLATLDSFLRDTWLECCGHLSAFRIGGVPYASLVDSGGYGFDDRSMRGVKLASVVAPGQHFEHEYDFGTTTELTLKVAGERAAEMRGKGVRVMARNAPPPIPCDACGQPATEVCSQCVYEGEGWLCATHAEAHECGEDMLLPVVNSPRTGMCGYTG